MKKMSRRSRAVSFLGPIFRMAVPPLVAGNLLAATPEISNRPPRADEWGYRPEDGGRAVMNPPGFTWMHEQGALTYDVQWARAPDFQDSVTVEGFRWNTYTHHETLPEGTWHWRYRFRNPEGQTSTWSRSRSFTLGPESIPFPMPTPEQQRLRVPAGHPRLFLRPEDLPRIRALAEGREAARFAALRKRADQVIAAGPAPEPRHMGSARDRDNAEWIRHWWPNRTQTDRVGEEAELLAFVYRITGEARYGEAARRWILHLAGWDPDGPTNFRMNCEAAKAFLLRLARAYDWAWDALDEADRIPVRAVMLRRASDAWESWEIQRGVGLLTRPYNSHGQRMWHILAEVGLAFLGEIPEAEIWVDFAVNKFFSTYPVWSDDEGGWHEGMQYWHSYLNKLTSWLLVARNALETDGFRKPFFARTADFPLYLAPPHSPNMGFGNLSAPPPHRGWGLLLNFLSRTIAGGADSDRASALRWWMESWNLSPPEGIMGFLHAALLPERPEARPPDAFPTSKVFYGVGIASLHTTLLDSRNNIHFLFKSSPMGRQSHGHNPQNSFQLNAFGEALLTTCVYRDLHGSRFHRYWAQSTQAHNAVLINQQGQTPHAPEARGRIIRFLSTPEFDYVAGDAVEAYAGRARRFDRHVLFVREPDPFILLLDDLETPEPATFQFMLHAFSPFEVNEEESRLAVHRPNAGVVVRYLSEVPLRFRQWDGYDPPPSEAFPNQWHVEAGTTRPVSRLKMLTLILPHRAGQAPELQIQRGESATAIGLRIAWNGRVRYAAFQKSGVEGAATLFDYDFDGPAVVREKPERQPGRSHE